MVLMTSFQLVQKFFKNAKRMQIGFNEDEIRAFLPRSYRKQELKEARMRAGIS